MKNTGRGHSGGNRKKVYHCLNCGRIQSFTNFECEGCGIDLGLYGKIMFIEDESVNSGGFSGKTVKKSVDEERIRAQAEKERLRQEKLRQQEEARRQAEEERRLSEERRQAQLRADAEAREKLKQEKLLAEQERKAQQQKEEAARKKAAEEKKIAEEAARRDAEEKKRREEAQRIAEKQAAEEARKKAEQERRRIQKEKDQEAAQKRKEEDEKRRQQRKDSQKKGSSGNNGSEKNLASKIFLILLSGLGIAAVLVILLMIIGINSRKCGDGLTWDFDEQTATLTIEGNGSMYDYAFAEDSGRMNHFPDLEEAPWMRDYRLAIQHVVIQEGAENIGACAFADCENLQDIVISDTVKTIAQLSLCNTALVNVTIPDSVKSIENEAFGSNRQLRNFIFAGKTPSFSESFLNGESEQLLIVGNDPVINNFAERHHIAYVMGSEVSDSGDFGGQSDDGNLRWSLNMYDRVLTISGSGPMENFNGKWMLDNEENKESLVEGLNFPYWTDYTRLVEELFIEDGITRIGDSAFEQCYNMRKVRIPGSVKYIGFQSFLCSGLIRITIPEGVTEIRDHAFNFCEKLQVVVLPESLERLQNGTFNMCNVLHSLTIGENTEVERRTGNNGCFSIFSNDHNPKGRPSRLVIIGKLGSDAHAFALEENFNFTERGLKANLTDTGKCGDQVTWKFVGDERTLYIEGRGSTWSYHVDEEALNTWAGYLRGSKQAREEDAEFLMYAKYIEHIVVKKGVTTLGHNLFSWHDQPQLVNLKTVDFGSVKFIQANLKFTSLESVELPESVVGIDSCCLANNTNLKTVVIRNCEDMIGAGLLYDCPQLTRVELHGRESLENYNGGYLFDRPGDLPECQLNPDLCLYVKPGSDGEKMAREQHIFYQYLKG